jgi:hypothetical protein
MPSPCRLHKLATLALLLASWLVASAQAPKPATGVHVAAPLTPQESTTICADAQTGGTARYIRDGATGANTGLNWTDAHDDLPTPLTRGRTYCVADGSYVTYTFDDTISGTTEITIKKATIGDHGTSTGWVDAYGDGQAEWNTMIFTTGYYTIHGAGRSSLTAGHGIRIGDVGSCHGQLIVIGTGGVGGSHHLTFKYLEVAGLGYIDNPTCADRGFYANGGVDGVHDITVQYSHLHGMFVPFLTRYTYNWLVERNYIADNSSTPENHAETWSDNASDEVTLRYNYIKNPEGSGMIFVGNGGTELSANDTNTSSNWHLYGNIIFQQGYTTGANHNGGIAGVAYCSNSGTNQNWCDGWLIFNNSIVNFDSGTQPARFFFEDVTGITQPIARNNIFYSNGAGAQHLNVTLTHNWYHSTTHTADSSNEQTGAGDPFVALASENFHLTAATTAGSTTSQPGGNTFDLDGVTRGADGTLDRGAFDYVAAGDENPLVFTLFRYPTRHHAAARQR